jgi:UDPglucose 6-dehydrogenase
LALIATARKVGAPADIAEATDRFNRRQVHWLADLVKSHVPLDGVVGILGLTYKPNTDVVEEAFGLLLAQELKRRAVKVVVYDPVGMENARRILGDGVMLAHSAQACIEAADVVVVATPWKEFASIPEGAWQRHSPPRVVFDCWRVVEHLQNWNGITYVPLGKGGAQGC